MFKNNINKKTELAKIIYTVFAVLLITIVYFQIFRFSSATGDESGELSYGITTKIVNLVEKLLPVNLPFNDSSEQIENIESFVRKAAHFLEYALLGILAGSIALCWQQNVRKPLLLKSLSLLFIVMLAALDEIHQYFVPGRYCSLKDVVIDSLGALIGMLFLIFLHKSYIRRRTKASRPG